MLPASAVAAAALVVVAIQDPGRFGLDDFGTPSGARSGEPVAALEASTPIPMAAPRTVMSIARGGADPAAAAARARTRDRVQLFRGPVPAERSGNVFAGAAPPPAFVLDAAPRTVTRGTIDVRNQAVPVAAPIPPGMLPMRGDASTDRAFEAGHAGREDPRDAWIALGLDRPADFARFLAGKSLAEQELWVERLADRAEARGLLDELVQALEATPSEVAGLLAADFVAEAGQLRAEAR